MSQRSQLVVINVKHLHHIAQIDAVGQVSKLLAVNRESVHSGKRISVELLLSAFELLFGVVFLFVDAFHQDGHG